MDGQYLNGSVPYISSGFKGEGLLDVSPNVPVACEVVTKMIEWLPRQHHGTVLGPIKESPLHRLRLTGPRRTQKVFQRRFGRHHVHVWIAIARYQVHMGQLDHSEAMSA